MQCKEQQLKAIKKIDKRESYRRKKMRELALCQLTIFKRKNSELVNATYPVHSDCRKIVCRDGALS